MMFIANFVALGVVYNTCGEIRPPIQTECCQKPSNTALATSRVDHFPKTMVNPLALPNALNPCRATTSPVKKLSLHSSKKVVHLWCDDDTSTGSATTAQISYYQNGFNMQTGHYYITSKGDALTAGIVDSHASFKGWLSTSPDAANVQFLVVATFPKAYSGEFGFPGIGYDTMSLFAPLRTQTGAFATQLVDGSAFAWDTMAYEGVVMNASMGSAIGGLYFDAYINPYILPTDSYPWTLLNDASTHNNWVAKGAFSGVATGGVTFNQLFKVPSGGDLSTAFVGNHNTQTFTTLSPSIANQTAVGADAFLSNTQPLGWKLDVTIMLTTMGMTGTQPATRLLTHDELLMGPPVAGNGYEANSYQAYLGASGNFRYYKGHFGIGATGANKQPGTYIPTSNITEFVGHMKRVNMATGEFQFWAVPTFGIYSQLTTAIDTQAAIDDSSLVFWMPSFTSSTPIPIYEQEHFHSVRNSILTFVPSYP